jgi:hypothetical protein
MLQPRLAPRPARRCIWSALPQGGTASMPVRENTPERAGLWSARSVSRPHPCAGRRESARLFARSPAVHWRYGLTAGGNGIRTAGPTLVFMVGRAGQQALPGRFHRRQDSRRAILDFCDGGTSALFIKIPPFIGSWHLRRRILMGENPDSPLSDWNNDRIEESRSHMMASNRDPSVPKKSLCPNA